MLLGAACGGGDKKEDASVAASTDETTTTIAAAAPSGGELGGEGCDTLLKSDVEGAVGAGFSEVQDTSQPGTIMCGYQRTEPLTIINYTIKPAGAGEYEATVNYAVESGATKEDVSGIGEKAARLTTTRSGVTVVQTIFVKGSALMYSTVTAQDAAISVAAADDMAKLLAERA